MAEPLPQPVSAAQPEPQPASAAQPEPAPEIPAQATSTVESDDDWDTAELTQTGDVMVPPMEVIGSMSRKASLALFGHA